MESSRASELSDGASVAAAVGVAFVAVVAAVVAEAAAADVDDDDDDDDDVVPNPVAAAAAAAVVVGVRVLWPRGIVSVEAAIDANDFKRLSIAPIMPWHRA